MEPYSAAGQCPRLTAERRIELAHIKGGQSRRSRLSSGVLLISRAGGNPLLRPFLAVPLLVRLVLPQRPSRRRSPSTLSWGTDNMSDYELGHNAEANEPRRKL